MKLGYARVSSAQQDHARQLAALEAAGCEKVFTDKWTGDSALRGRSGGSELTQHARRGDRIIATERSAR